MKLTQELLDVIFPQTMGVFRYPKLINGEAYFFNSLDEDKEKEEIGYSDFTYGCKYWFLENDYTLIITANKKTGYVATINKGYLNLNDEDYFILQSDIFRFEAEVLVNLMNKLLERKGN